MKKLLIAIFILFLLGAVLVRGKIYKTDTSVFVAGVIRNNGDGWRLIKDSGHEPLGITAVSQNDKCITVYYQPKSKVNALTVTVDETMCASGYRVGASVGLEEARIYIYDKKNSLVNPEHYISSTGNIWMQGIFTK